MSVGEGHRKNYNFTNKTEWRWRIWKRVAKLIRRPHDARVVLMPGPQCNDIYTAMSLGFKPKNMLCVERDKDVARHIRKSFGALTICIGSHEFASRYSVLGSPLDRIDVIFWDWCGGLTQANDETLSLSLEMFDSGRVGVLAANILRGRDVKSKQHKHRGLRAVLAMRGSSCKLGKPKFYTYSSGNLKYDSFAVQVLRDHEAESSPLDQITSELLLEEIEARTTHFTAIRELANSSGNSDKSARALWEIENGAIHREEVISDLRRIYEANAKAKTAMTVAKAVQSRILH